MDYLITKSYCLAVLLFLIFFGLAITASAIGKPQFQSGASLKIGMDVDFNALYSKANPIYDVVEHDDNHIIWKFSQTTGDWAFVQKDGTLAVASTSGMHLAVRDKLTAECYDEYSMILAAKGTVSGNLGPITYYTDKSEVYRVIQQEFDSNFAYSLNVPNCTINEVRLSVNGGDLAELYSVGEGVKTEGQQYRIDGKLVSGCNLDYGGKKMSGESCSEVSDLSNFDLTGNVWVSPVYVTNVISPGLHTIEASGIDNKHTMWIEAITTPSAKPMVLYNQPKTIWVEDKDSKSLDELYALIQPTNEAVNTTGTTPTPMTNTTV